MIYLLTETLNVNNQKYYYCTMQDLINNFASNQTGYQLTEDNYRLNNNILRVQAYSDMDLSHFTIGNAHTVHSVIHVIPNTVYKRVYNVTGYEIQSGYAEFTLKLDLWHTYIEFANIHNLHVTRCTRDILQNSKHVGYFSDPIEAMQKPQYEHLVIKSITNPSITLSYGNNNEKMKDSDFMLVIAIKYNVKELQSGALTNTRLFALNLHTVFDTIKSDYPQSLKINALEDFLSGIYKMATHDTPPQYTDCQPVGAWIIEKELVKYEIQSGLGYDMLDVTSNIKGLHDVTVTSYRVLASNLTRTLTYTNIKNSNVYLGLMHNNIKISNIKGADQVAVNLHFVIGADDVKVLLIEGDKQINITSGFAVNFTTVEGDIRNERQVVDELQNTMPLLASMVSMGAGIATQNPMLVATSVVGMANTMVSNEQKALTKHIGSLIKAGDATTNFFKGAIYLQNPAIPDLDVYELNNPYYAIIITDTTTNNKEVEYYGLTYQTTVADFATLFTFNNASTGNAGSADTVDGFDFLQLSDMTFTGNIPNEAQEYIYNKLRQGIRIKRNGTI